MKREIRYIRQTSDFSTRAIHAIRTSNAQFKSRPLRK